METVARTKGLLQPVVQVLKQVGSWLAPKLFNQAVDPGESGEAKAAGVFSEFIWADMPTDQQPTFKTTLEGQDASQ